MKLLMGLLISCMFLGFAGDDDKEINAFIDAWHIAAAKADKDAFFGVMTDRFRYLGTEAGEQWVKKDFWVFAKPYFERGKAWAFTPYDRHIFRSGHADTVWFHEHLKTQMGICMGSGVLVKKEGKWMIEHYHLSKTIPNKRMDDVLKLLGEAKKDGN